MQKYTTVILVRHGQSTWNAEQRWQGQADPPLSEKGRAQAQLVAERLSSRPISALYCSDLRRAAATAQIIGDRLNLPLRYDARWQERDLGGWSGLTMQEISERYPAQYRDWHNYVDIRPGGGELFGEFQQRTAAALQEVIADHAGETVGVVIHGGVIFTIRGYVLGLEMGPEMFEGLPPNRNTAVTVIRFGNGQAELSLLMDSSHLDGMMVE